MSSTKNPLPVAPRITELYFCGAPYRIYIHIGSAENAQWVNIVKSTCDAVVKKFNKELQRQSTAPVADLVNVKIDVDGLRIVLTFRHEQIPTYFMHRVIVAVIQKFCDLFVSFRGNFFGKDDELLGQAQAEVLERKTQTEVSGQEQVELTDQAQTESSEQMQAELAEQAQAESSEQTQAGPPEFDPVTAASRERKLLEQLYNEKITDWRPRGKWSNDGLIRARATV